MIILKVTTGPDSTEKSLFVVHTWFVVWFILGAQGTGSFDFCPSCSLLLSINAFVDDFQTISKRTSDALYVPSYCLFQINFALIYFLPLSFDFWVLKLHSIEEQFSN